jgi:hypothetical protein
MRTQILLPSLEISQPSLDWFYHQAPVAMAGGQQVGEAADLLGLNRDSNPQAMVLPVALVHGVVWTPLVSVEVAHQVVEGQQGEYLLKIPSAVKAEVPEAVEQIAGCHPLRKRSAKMEAVRLEVAPFVGYRHLRKTSAKPEEVEAGLT